MWRTRSLSRSRSIRVASASDQAYRSSCSSQVVPPIPPKSAHCSIPELQDKVQGVPHQVEQYLLRHHQTHNEGRSRNSITSLSRFVLSSNTFLTTRSR